MVQADRGEDLGVVTDIFSVQDFLDRRYHLRAYMDEEDQTVGYVLRVASTSEMKLLAEKYRDEEMIFRVRILTCVCACVDVTHCIGALLFIYCLYLICVHLYYRRAKIWLCTHIS